MRYLTYQQVTEGAGVYGLITKANFHRKPILKNYEMVFENLTQEFKKKGFSMLVCYPMGCVRDLVEFSTSPRGRGVSTEHQRYSIDRHKRAAAKKSTSSWSFTS